MLFFLESLSMSQKSVHLQCVFHSIRFKVNKGWSTAVLLFLCSYVSFWGEKITRSMLSFLAYRFVLAPFLLPLSH